MKGQFEKGGIPWNKGLRGIHLSPSSEFKKGQYVMENHPSWRGGVQHVKNDCVYLSVAAGVRKRRPRKVYEDTFGPLPEGHIVYHRDGDRENDDPGNLEAITRAELVKRNNRR